MSKKHAFSCALALAALQPCVALASEASIGFVNNDGTRLTMALDGAAAFPLDDDPEIPVLPGIPKGFGFLYFGAGFTHDGDPSVLWTGTPTDVGMKITSIVHDGTPVSSGFQIASGELGAFNDIYVLGIPPENRVGPGQSALFIPSDALLDAQLGDPNDPAYENHAHTYLEAASPGAWDVTFVLTDMATTPIYADSQPFTVHFEAVPEPTTLTLLGAAVAMIAARRRRVMP